MEPKTLTNFMNELKERGIRKQNQFQLVITTGIAEVDESLQNITMWASTCHTPCKTARVYRCILSRISF